MWLLHNTTPYAAERAWVRDKNGLHHWITAIKGTFSIRENGDVVLAEVQEAPRDLPLYWGDPGASSLRYEVDLGPMKVNTDVLVNASAYANGASQVAVTFRLGSLHKSLVVYGERYFGRTMGVPTIRDAEPFSSKPIRYESAWGGTDRRDPRREAHDPRNPIGRGLVTARAHLDGQAAPTIVYPRGNFAEQEPAGFGAIASYWSPRRELGGTYDDAWRTSKFPLLPDDYDDAYTLCAPTDQRPPSYLRGGELVELVNMTPNGGMRFSLPKLAFGLTTEFGPRREEHHARLVSIVIEPDDRRLLMTWQSSLAVHASEAAYLDRTRIREKRWIS